MIREGDYFVYKRLGFINMGNGILSCPITGEVYGLHIDYKSLSKLRRQVVVMYTAEQMYRDLVTND